MKAARSKFGFDKVIRDQELKPSKPMDFAVARDDGRIVSSLQESQVLGRIPAERFDYVFIVPELREEAEQWLKQNLQGILTATVEEEA